MGHPPARKTRRRVPLNPWPQNASLSHVCIVKQEVTDLPQNIFLLKKCGIIVKKAEEEKGRWNKAKGSRKFQEYLDKEKERPCHILCDKTGTKKKLHLPEEAVEIMKHINPQ